MPRYLVADICIFWLPSLILYIGLVMLRKINHDRIKSFWINLCIWLPVTFVCEYVYLKLDFWNFSEQIDPLVGIYLWGAPIEEFVFWFGAPVFFMLVYLFLNKLLPKRRKPRAASTA